MEHICILCNCPASVEPKDHENAWDILCQKGGHRYIVSNAAANKMGGNQVVIKNCLNILNKSKKENILYFHMDRNRKLSCKPYDECD